MNQILQSKEDKSINFIEEQLTGFLESRYVRKYPEYFNCYLSSQTGCNKGCKFCHLTATGQTAFEDSDYQDFLNQALQVFRHYRRENQPAKAVHYAFMARGEALANKHLLRDAGPILLALAALAREDGLLPKFNISTIMPSSLGSTELNDIFKIVTPTIYYSLYSVSEVFRKKWMPAAMPVHKALELLKEYQYQTKKIIKIHYAFIKDENDTRADVTNVLRRLEQVKLLYDFNIVRYNPFSPEQGEESENLSFIQDLIQEYCPGQVKLIPRVGTDVKASCGMFIQ